MLNHTIVDNQVNKNQTCDIYNEKSCSVTAAMSVIGGKWKLILINAIRQNEPARFGVLKRKLPGITQSMLTAQLRELEDDGIISRTIYAEIPPRVEYNLTPFGLTLEPVVKILADWGKSYQEKHLSNPQ